VCFPRVNPRRDGGKDGSTLISLDGPPRVKGPPARLEVRHTITTESADVFASLRFPLEAVKHPPPFFYPARKGGSDG